MKIDPSFKIASVVILVGVVMAFINSTHATPLDGKVDGPPALSTHTITSVSAQP